MAMLPLLKRKDGDGRIEKSCKNRIFHVFYCKPLKGQQEKVSETSFGARKLPESPPGEING